MKRYLVICNDQYYASGFPDEVRYSSDDIEEAIGHAKLYEFDYKCVFDCDTREIVYKEDSDLYGEDTE